MFTHEALRSSYEFVQTCSSVPDRIGIWKFWFLRRGENRSTRRKTSRGKGENQQQTQPTYGVDAGIWTRATLVGGECSHHCAIFAPQKTLHKNTITLHFYFLEHTICITHCSQEENHEKQWRHLRVNFNDRIILNNNWKKNNVCEVEISSFLWPQRAVLIKLLCSLKVDVRCLSLIIFFKKSFCLFAWMTYLPY